jgi:predicted ABC-type ATPase
VATGGVYTVKLIFLALPDAEMALVRVASRVAQGGHNVPEAILRRRFAHGIENFHNRYKTLVDTWLFYDNAANPPYYWPKEA